MGAADKEKFVRVDQSRNGVKVIVYRFESGGTTVEADCKCLGMPNHTHSVIDCPNMPEKQ